MKISKTQHNYFNKQATFKKGLTSAEIQAVKNMTNNDCLSIAEKIRNKYGVETRLFEVPALTFCVEKSLEIMKRAGFKLPKSIVFSSLNENIAGCYNDKIDTIFLNCSLEKYYDLELLNKAEEAQGTFHPKNHHFLSTFLHELSHAAHYKHLCDRLGKEKGNNVYWGVLSDLSPTELMINPAKTILSANPILRFSSILDEIFPPKYGYYAATDLAEYFAEKNSYDISEQLGANFNISNVKKDNVREFKIRPSSWSFSNAYAEKLRNRSFKEIVSSVTLPYRIYLETRDLKAIFKEHLDYTNNEIWDGREENLVNNKLLWNNKK